MTIEFGVIEGDLPRVDERDDGLLSGLNLVAFGCFKSNRSIYWRDCDVFAVVEG